MRNTPVTWNRTQAFSLIELLVVVTIIVILSALAVPGIKRVMSSAKQSECATNMRQISSALFAYAADNDGFLPAVSTVWGPSGDDTMWSYRIWTYAGYSQSSYILRTFDIGLRPQAKGKNIFRCPGNAIAFIKAPTVGQPVNGNKLSYGLNCGPVGDNGTDWKTPIALARATNASRTVMVTETSYCLGSRSGFFDYYGLTPHKDGGNFLFYDGHVEYMPFTEARKTRSDTTFWGN